MNRITKELQQKHAELLYERAGIVAQQAEVNGMHEYAQKSELTQQSRNDIDGYCDRRRNKLQEELKRLDNEISLIVKDLSPAPD